MTARDPTNAETWLLSLPPTRRQTRWVIAVAVCQLAGFALLAPFAAVQVRQINGFIPVVECIEFMTNLVTSVLLFSQFATHRLSSLLVLACGYLLSALIIIPHALSFAGAFSPLALPGAGLQTTAWLSWFWHIPFAMALLGYGLMRNKKSKPGPGRGSSFAVIVRSVSLVLALIGGLILLATVGADRLPALFEDSVRRLPANELADYSLAAIAMLLCASAVAVLWLGRRSVLDQWLMIVALGLILEVGIIVLLSPRRFDFGFYAGRLFSLVTSATVMIVLLVETMRLYADVARFNEGKLRRFVDSNIIGILIGNPDGYVQEANQAFLRIVGYDQADLAAGRLSRTVLTPAEWHDRDARALTEMRATGTAQPFEKEYVRKDGSRVPVLVGGATLDERGDAVVVFAVDLTELKRAEEAARESDRRYHQIQIELAHAQRVVTLGQLSASIAHEISQPLSGIVTNADLCLRILAADPPNVEGAQETARRAIRDANRAGEIVSRLRALFVTRTASTEMMNLNEAVREVISLSRGELQKDHVNLQSDLAENLPPIRGDRIQLQQVLLNLIRNAVDAMRNVDDRARQLVVTTTKVEPGSVLVAVRDTGSGIDPANLERVFDAFYTTKTDGLGMGLSVCRAIVEAHGGRLWATSAAPHGAVFQFTLPIEGDGTLDEKQALLE
jgi:PAS domain S-box-containing protein